MFETAKQIVAGMMSTGRIRFYVIGIPAVIVLLKVIKYFNVRRTGKLRSMAAGLGLPFESDCSGENFLKDTELSFFSAIGDRVAVNCMRLEGFHGGTLRFFDFADSEDSGETDITANFTLAFFDAGKVVFPTFELKPENLITRIGELAGVEDINFTGFPEFSKNYKLNADSEERVRAFLNPDVLGWLGRNPGFRVQARGRYLAAYIKTGALPVDDYPNFIECSKYLVSLLVK